MPPLSQSDLNSLYGQMGYNPGAGDSQSFLQYANNGSVPLTAFDIGQVIQGTPQYQTNLLNTFGSNLNNILGQSDQRLLGIAQTQATQQFASQGRNIGSSGYLNAFAQQAANLATQRQQQLAGFYGQGYQNIMGMAGGQANQSQQFGLGQQASTVGWQRANAMYSRQLADQQSWQNSQNSRGLGAGFNSVLGSVGQLGQASGSFAKAGQTGGLWGYQGG